jgi:hypothetical protein
MIFGKCGKGLVFRCFSNDGDFLPRIYLAVFAYFLVDGKCDMPFSRELGCFLGGTFYRFLGFVGCLLVHCVSWKNGKGEKGGNVEG